MDKDVIEFDDAKFYTITKAAEMLGITLPTLRKYIKEKNIKTVKLGRRRLIPVEEIKKIFETK